MNTALNLPPWRCNSPPNSPDSTEDLDLIIGRLSSCAKSAFYGVSEVRARIPPDSGMPAKKSPSASDCIGAGGKKFDDAHRLNNNVSDSGSCDVEKCNTECPRHVRAAKRRRRSPEREPGDERGAPKRRKSPRHVEEPRADGAAVENSVCELSSECDAGTVGGGDDDDDEDEDDDDEDEDEDEEEDEEEEEEDEEEEEEDEDDEDDDDDDDNDDDDKDEEEERERSPRRQHKLNPSDEINKPDVIMSRDITSNPSSDGKSCTDDEENGTCGRGRTLRKGSCSAGSYSRRKHHKHKRRAQTPPPEESTPANPRVNPIFLWIRQDDTRIVEVMCEDYDHRNRIRLTKTHLGWRAIPKTERFAAAIIPKAPPPTEESAAQVEAEPPSRRSHRRKSNKRKKSKKRKVPASSVSEDIKNCIKECTIRLSRDEVRKYQEKNSSVDSDNHSTWNSTSVAEETSEASTPGESPRRSPSRESSGERPPPAEAPQRLKRSASCDFPPRSGAVKRNLSRSCSLDLSPRPRDEFDVKPEQDLTVQKKTGEESGESGAVDEVGPGAEDGEEEESDVTKEDAKTEESGGKECEKGDEKANLEVMDMTKHDSDFNDADCDALGQLLKDMPDLEFMEEEELEEVDEEEEWSTPTDLTVPKAKNEESERPKPKLPVLPPNISPLVTVTSSTRSPQPLTAPLPEVTITPIPNPKPAHQQKPQNFLETLLSAPVPVKPEKEEISISRTLCDRRMAADRRKIQQPEAEAKNKKMKVEDITLKSLLSKHGVEKATKGMELEHHVKKIKSKQESEGFDISKSRLHELLTEGVSSSSSSNNNSSSDPIAQLKQVLSNPDLAVPDPLLVPRARLPALVASPASEIPRLLTMHLDKKIEETPCPPLTDSDMLEVSLSNLRSLLSCSPDKIKSTNAEDLASYQKSLEAFLEWQRYQTELMEAQIKSAPLAAGLSPSEIDIATATALNQMLWLPYLELSGGSMASPMNPMFPHNYHVGGNLNASPHMAAAHFPQSSPFLTPTSPMDVDAQLKTLAMWQEAVMSQQSGHQSRKFPNSLLTPMQQEGKGLKIPGASAAGQKKQRLSPIPSPQKMKNCPQFSPRLEPHKNHFNFDGYHQLQYQQQQQQALIREQYEMQRKQHKRSGESPRQAEQHRQRQEQSIIQQLQSFAARADADGKNRGSISVRPLSNLVDKGTRQGRKQSWQQLEQYLMKSASLSNQMTARWSQFEEEMRRSELQATKGKVGGQNPWLQTAAAAAAAQEKLAKAEESHRQEREKSGETAKLKVKNLVDPNVAPPKLLKESPAELPVVADDSAPMQDETQAHLWHPLFGSNQIKTQPYNSPWRWTTVTVNGE